LLLLLFSLFFFYLFIF
jgi:hypothetical protein